MILTSMCLLQVQGQNLVPNPGFEEPMMPEALQWVQPQGPFYHYEHKPEGVEDAAHNGHYINGLCMYNHEPNEYLHVRLKEPLVQGQRYVFSVHARLYKTKAINAELQQYIGVHFGNRRLDTHVPGDMPFNPQLHIRLPDGDRFAWFELRDTLTAKGGEQYLTMGYFPNTQRRENDERKIEAFMADVDRMYEAQQRKESTQTDKSWLYMSPADQKEYLKVQKKQNKKKKKELARTRNEVACPEPASTGRSLRTPVVPVSPAASFGPDELFTVRYYFDDFCLALLRSDGYRCEEEEDGGMRAQLSTGSTFALPNVFFELDKDALLDESIVQLEGLRQTLLQYPALHIEIRGHTDAQGSEAHNLDLSRRRAASVVSWLVKHGIEAGRLSSKGFGAGKPIASNDDEAGRARNRRVECYVREGL